MVGSLAVLVPPGLSPSAPQCSEMWACVVVLVSVVLVSADDEIHNLPGLNFEINFRHYSGFLKASDTHFLHYW